MPVRCDMHALNLSLVLHPQTLAVGIALAAGGRLRASATQKSTTLSQRSGPERVRDRYHQPPGIVDACAQDRRALMWDLDSEPGNSGRGHQSLPLVEATFAWARAAHPSQPLTRGPWGAPPEITPRQLELPGVPSFHFYAEGRPCDPERLEAGRRITASKVAHGNAVDGPAGLGSPQ